MVLIDTSIWIDHLRKNLPRLAGLLDEGEVAIHPFVIGELACGNLGNRNEILSLFQSLPTISRVEDGEILFFIEHHSLSGRGLGLIDIHLLAACRMSGLRLWTKDIHLKSAAEKLHLSFGAT